MSWRCRLGIHQWYRDGAMFASADRCNRCERWKHPRAGAEVERERWLWTQAPDGEDKLGWVSWEFLKGTGRD